MISRNIIFLVSPFSSKERERERESERETETKGEALQKDIIDLKNGRRKKSGLSKQLLAEIRKIKMGEKNPLQTPATSS